MKPVLVWDVPTRLFHWLFASSIAAAWLSQDTDRWLSVHVFFGYLALGLIGFRLIWGIVGGHYARFASFRHGPLAGLAYLRQMASGTAARYVGHNPAGSQAVYLLLAVGLVTCISGLLTMGAEEGQGLAARWVGIGAGGMVKQAHNFGAWVMLLLVLGHLAGVAIESWLHRENLPKSMVTGVKEADQGAIASQPHRRVGGALAVAVTAFGASWFFYALEEPVEAHLGVDDGDKGVPRVAFVGRALPDDPLWREECGSCHQPFHASLLPARSWRRLIAEQEQHFGVDLGLAPATRESLLAFMTANAGDRGSTEAAFKINQSISPDAVPLRITETPYWMAKHASIKDSDWMSPKIGSKTNCVACHHDALAGTFEDAAMAIPR